MVIPITKYGTRVATEIYACAKFHGLILSGW